MNKISIDVAEDVHETVPCKYKFCHDCLLEWVKKNKTCPMNRIVIADLKNAFTRYTRRNFQTVKKQIVKNMREEGKDFILFLCEHISN